MPDHASMWFLVTHTGRRIPISTLPIDIGSDASSGVHIPDPSVAPLHARLLHGAATGLRLEVCEGALVEVDGWALTEADLREGDELLVGAVTVRLESGGPGVKRLRTASRPSRRAAPGSTRPPARRGLLHADLSQLSIGTRCILGLALLLLAAAIVWAAQALVLALA
jgi:hypothetical protein